MAPMNICKCCKEPFAGLEDICADCRDEPSNFPARGSVVLGDGSTPRESEAAKARAALADMATDPAERMRLDTPRSPTDVLREFEHERKAAGERADRVVGGLSAAAVLIASAQKVGNVETKSDLVRAVLKGAMVDDVDAAIRALVEVLRCLAPERLEGV